jgi:N-acetylglucosaminyldiphosphoundecaprenol N-acetyl-beta-D-mannosaminyltransferase
MYKEVYPGEKKMKSIKRELLGTKIDEISKETFILRLQKMLKAERCQYVCFIAAHALVTSVKDRRMRDTINGAAIASPDGMPLVWLGKAKGYDNMEKCSGPDMMGHILEDSEKMGYTQYFYGGTDESLEALRQNLSRKYPLLKILGMYSPPFRPLTQEEDERVINEINEKAPDFIWVGIGAPKQEFWIAEHANKINRGVMFGVGAAFDFHAGTLKRAPLWMQKHGLEWFYRLTREPGRLWKRYLVTNTLFVRYAITDLLRGKGQLER